MDLQLLWDEFSSSMVRERSIDTAERLSDWSAAVKKRLVHLGKRRGYTPIANDDKRKSAAYLWDVSWCVEDKRKRGAPPTGAGVPHLDFPLVPYRKLVLTAEVEWGRQGQRAGTAVYRRNLEEVFRDFYKVLDARSTTKVMVYSSWHYPGQAGLDGWFLDGFRQILLDYQSHRPGDQYLFIEFDDAARELRGYTTDVPSRGPRSFKIRELGVEPYPRRWDPKDP
jgi:hypothetical protein